MRPLFATYVSSASSLLFNTEGNECATIIQSIDWSNTSLGTMNQWPQCLHITLATILNSKFPMFIFWGNDHICFYNDAARFRSEGRHPFALGKTAEVVWKDSWEAIKSKIDRVMKYGESSWYEDEEILITVNGGVEKIYSTYSYSAIYNEYGERTGVLVTGIDSTEKVKNFKKLEESDKNFRNLITQAPVGIAILRGRDFTFEIANEIYLKLTGKTANIINQPMVKVLPEIKEQGFLDMLTKVMLTGMSYHGKEYPITLTRNGKSELIYLNFVYEPMKESNGNIKRIMVIAIDVTDQVVARKKVEDSQIELLQMAESMPHVVWIANANGDITYFSDRVSKFSGVERSAEGTWRWTDMLHTEDVPSTTNAWLNALQHGTLYEAEHRIRMTDGSFKWHLSRACPYKDEDGKVIKWFGTATDIDEQKRLSEQLEIRVQERTKELQNSNNELAQFAYVASHDLQEPLRKIITFIQLLQRDVKYVNEKSKGYLEKIANSAQRMSTLIKDILNFSQLSHASEVFKMVDLNESLNSILNDFELLIQQKNAVIKSNNLPVLQAIPMQINQLFYNLISNSLKFVNEEQQPIVNITSRLLTKAEVAQIPELNPTLSFYEIRFSDNGIGFDQKYAEQIFTIFQRLNNRQSFSGTGIGLALCKKIVMNHNGYIMASSKENHGSNFTVLLPERQLV